MRYYHNFAALPAFTLRCVRKSQQTPLLIFPDWRRRQVGVLPVPHKDFLHARNFPPIFFHRPRY